MNVGEKHYSWYIIFVWLGDYFKWNEQFLLQLFFQHSRQPTTTVAKVRVIDTTKIKEKL